MTPSGLRSPFTLLALSGVTPSAPSCLILGVSVFGLGCLLCFNDSAMEQTWWCTALFCLRPSPDMMGGFSSSRFQAFPISHCSPSIPYSSYTQTASGSSPRRLHRLTCLSGPLSSVRILVTMCPSVGLHPQHSAMGYLTSSCSKTSGVSSGETVFHALGISHFLGKSTCFLVSVNFRSIQTPVLGCRGSISRTWSPLCHQIVNASSLYHPTYPPVPQSRLCVWTSRGINACPFLPSQQRPSPREYEESASVGQGRWRTSANSKVLRSSPAACVATCSLCSELLLGRLLPWQVLTAFLLPGQVRLIAASRRCPKAWNSLKIFGRRYRAWGPKNLGLQGGEHRKRFRVSGYRPARVRGCGSRC